MTREETLAYQKGYAAGSRGRWPAHRPPQPPEPLIAGLLAAATQLRNAADTICAQLDDGDEFVAQLGPPVDALDSAMVALTEWLTKGRGE